VVDVSVVLPYRDVAETIVEACTSVLAERGVDLELLAIDDGSRDASASLVSEIARRDPRVRLLSTSGAGLVAALNLGLREARAPLVARMDGDDVSLPERFAAQLHAMRSTDATVVGTRVEAYPEGVIEDGLRRYVDWQNALLSAHDHAREVFIEAPLCHPSVMMRKGDIHALGGYRHGEFPEDYDLWLRLIRAGHALAKLPLLGLRWRHRAGRLTFGDARYGVDRIRALKAEHLAASLASERRAIVIWGAGPFGRRLARAMEPHGIRAHRFVDIDPRKIGRVARGVRVVDPTGLDPRSDFVVFAVGALGARALVRAALADLGFVETRDYLCAT
jgi:glycosyltransferase involved in cell wall biosynthesis